MWVILAYWLSGVKTASKKVYRTKREAKEAEKWLWSEFKNSLWQTAVAPVGSRYK